MEPFRRSLLQTVTAGIGIGFAGALTSQAAPNPADVLPVEAAGLGVLHRWTLMGPAVVAAVRARSARRGPDFVGYPGLLLKLDMIDGDDPAFAEFTAWATPGSALAYLDSPELAEQVRSLGKPTARLLLPRALAVAPAGARWIRLLEADASTAPIRVYDPGRDVTTSAFFDNGPGLRLGLACVVGPQDDAQGGRDLVRAD